MSSTITPFARSFLFKKVDAKLAKHRHPQLLPYIHIVHTQYQSQMLTFLCKIVKNLRPCLSTICFHLTHGAMMAFFLSGARRNCILVCLFTQVLTELTITMTKSSQHQALVKYLTKPNANHFTTISMVNITVKIRSM